MPYRLEYKKRASFDKDGKPPEWEPFFPLGTNDQGQVIGDTHKKKSEITKWMDGLRQQSSLLLSTHVFRIVVTGVHGDTAILKVHS